jgi:isopentenyl-diphosphate delta-isomerase
MEKVILVNEQDSELGLMEKMEAHRRGLLHRAFSVFVLNSKRELMLQQRALEKYHSGGLWTNTCCSHPRKGETVEQAAHRRMQEEMGFDCSLAKELEFTYRAELDKNMIEHEYDHLFIGYYEGEPQLNREEAMNWRWVDVDILAKEIQERPEEFTAWFKIIYQQFMQAIKTKM